MNGGSADSSDPAGDQASDKRALGRRWLLVAGFVGVVTLVLAVYPRNSSLPPLPRPNGYDALVHAATKVVAIRSEKSLKEMTTNELAALVATNHDALVELRGALGMPSAVPLEFDENWISNQMTNTTNLKEAAWSMRAEILYHQRQGELAGALDESFDLLRFARAFSRGGVLIDMLVGTACEAIAVRGMTNFLPSLSVEQCKRASSVLEKHEAQREPFAEIMTREKEWQRKTFGFRMHLYEAIRVHVFRQAGAGSLLVPNAEKEYNDRTLEVRHLMLAIASRAFELEKGRKPQRASELVPAYLRTRPIDPTSGSALELP